MRWMLAMLIFVPISIVLSFTHVGATWMFAISCLAIIPLAGVMGTATEELAKYRGSAVGGLLNATFGNATELIISLVAVMNGEEEVVKASLIGSIIGNVLLVLGLSILLGGIRHKEQSFNREAAGTHGATMFLAVISLLVPALFAQNMQPRLAATDPHIVKLSLWVSAVLIFLYVGNLVFSLRTHQNYFRGAEEDHAEEPTMSQGKAMLILLVSTLFIAFESELLVKSIEPVVHHLHISKMFLGIVIVPIIGNAAEHSTAVLMALRNKMDISLNIAVSSATQIAMFVAPFIIIASQFMAHPITILFSNVELIAVAVAVIITGQVTRDGKSNWLEGAQLLAVYIIVALAFYFVP